MPIHLLITGIVMPGIPETKVLYVSGYTNDDVVRNGVLHDAVHFVQKSRPRLSSTRCARFFRRESRSGSEVGWSRTPPDPECSQDLSSTDWQGGRRKRAPDCALTSVCPR